eukprot:TRINITY_DN60974_c0_g1_i1.p1 TRINITY_DN60974_c0_g1~~TRINITY_DN60974_c0_g1_i1.p1  ORF type:complete len:819 (+),score=138.96 TRINITY_DN60974_c0_g1_i1:127-2457(+)
MASWDGHGDHRFRTSLSYTGGLAAGRAAQAGVHPPSDPPPPLALAEDGSTDQNATAAAICSEAESLTPFTPEWTTACGLVLLCICTAAIAAGLTMGLVSLDVVKLRVTCEAVADLSGAEEDSEAGEQEGLEEEAKLSQKVLPLVERHHLLLVTLLLSNAVANECMPIFLDRIVPSWMAVLLSVTFVLIFGEIVPSAFFTGKGQLRRAAFFTPLVWVLIYVTWPISWPIGKLLDCVFGHHSGEEEAFSRGELKAFIRMHGRSDPKHLVRLHSAEDPLEQFQERPPQKQERAELESCWELLKLKKTPDGKPGIHHAKFSMTTHEELQEWLQGLFRKSAWVPEGTWKVLTHPLTRTERLHFRTPRATVAFSSQDDAERACHIVNACIIHQGGGSWLHGWVRTQAEYRGYVGDTRLGRLLPEECHIISGCLDLNEARVGEAVQFHRFDDDKLYMLAHNTVLDEHVQEEIRDTGFSRIPVYQVLEQCVAVPASELQNFEVDREGGWGKWNKVKRKSFPQCGKLPERDHWVCAINGERVRSVEELDRKLSGLRGESSGEPVKVTLYDRLDKAGQDARIRPHICGVLLTRQLIALGTKLPTAGELVEQRGRARYPLILTPQDTLLTALMKFRGEGGLVEGFGRGGTGEGKPVSHMAVVTDKEAELRECWRLHQEELQRGEVPHAQVGRILWANKIEDGSVRLLGMLTLEDVIEEFLGDIQDESDRGARRVHKHGRGLSPRATSFATTEATPLLRQQDTFRGRQGGKGQSALGVHQLARTGLAH